MNGSYPISDEKRLQLRLDGVVSFSRDFISAGLILGLAAVFFLISTQFVFGLQELSRDLFSLPFDHSDKNEYLLLVITSFFSLCWKTVLWSLISLVFFVALLGLLQNRFLFLPALVFSASKKQRPLTGGGLSYVRRMQRLTFGLVKYVALISLIYVLCGFLFDGLQVSTVKIFQLSPLSASNHQSFLVDFMNILQAPFYWIFAAVSGFMGFVGLVSLVFSKIQYESDHQMTRQEIEAEYRESSRGIASESIEFGQEVED